MKKFEDFDEAIWWFLSISLKILMNDEFYRHWWLDFLISMQEYEEDLDGTIGRYWWCILMVVRWQQDKNGKKAWEDIEKNPVVVVV